MVRVLSLVNSFGLFFGNILQFSMFQGCSMLILLMEWTRQTLFATDFSGFLDITATKTQPSYLVTAKDSFSLPALYSP